ncbi:MAG TPA: N-acetyl-alpha-D-glucosaminyl L-malate synthase BshA [Vulgatibacter sp.]|nr:N-acetyl-alpha-D-glucosaminyl L-malate synthase BshA [Vulgatibacter sp.]
MNPLTIGMVCFPSLGGSGVVATELAMGLAERGHRVHLVSSARPGRLESTPPQLAVHVADVPDYPLFEHAPYESALASKILEVARAHRLDLLHVHYAVPHAACGALARAFLGPGAPPLVTSLHGTDVNRTGSDPRLRAITAAAVAASDGIVAPSAWLRQEARDRLGIEADVEIIANFVDTERFSPPRARDPSRLLRLFPEGGSGPILFHVSNFRTVKRTPDLPEILARVRRHLPARLVLVGDGPDRERVEARVHELGLCGSVRFLGPQGTAFVEELRHADAFLLPSESESFGLAALEALACGVPVFGYRVGGLDEVVPPDVGALVDPFDADALAARIVATLATPGARDRLGAAARARALDRFRRDLALDRYLAFYRRILASRAEQE